MVPQTGRWDVKRSVLVGDSKVTGKGSPNRLEIYSLSVALYLLAQALNSLLWHVLVTIAIWTAHQRSKAAELTIWNFSNVELKKLYPL